MLARINSGAVYGVDAYPVEIEVNAASAGDPQTVIVGLPDAAVKESKDRVHTAIHNSGYTNHNGRVTVNLAPADIKKEGPNFDLPIAIGVLAATGEIDVETLGDCAIIGELALSGEVRRIKGVLPIAMRMRAEGIQRILVPAPNADEAGVVDGIAVYAIDNLREAVEYLRNDRELQPYIVDPAEIATSLITAQADYSDVKGQETAKRAFEIAVSGGHNLLAIGPPGTGKSMLAKRIPSVLPPLTLEEALEATRIHSIAGTLEPHRALVSRRPFRAPHHTISDAGLLGGGTHPMPGEVSLAHRGVLFLDELPEFHRNVLEVLRQPLEDGRVTISRAAGSVTFPCEFMLVAAMNPCPCGFWGDPKRECRCSPTKIQNYRNKISGPLLDRIDIHVEVPAISYDQLTSLEPGEPSAAVRERVVDARGIQQKRFAEIQGMHCNAGMDSKAMQAHCELDRDSQVLLKAAITELNFSARAYDRILRVARTIADLDHALAIAADHIAEAIQYRTLDRQTW